MQFIHKECFTDSKSVEKAAHESVVILPAKFPNIVHGLLELIL